MPGETYYRCRHCRGFYETTFTACKWCSYQTPFVDTEGKPRVFPDRQACRALQIAEYEQLPAEAYKDCMGPPPDDLTLLCNCLHCGPEGYPFEAVEMRWIANEKMWACPCTTCGGRGFSFDIHSAENKWQCVECGHFYVPKDGDYRASNAECPKCGCTHANGWFDDEYDEEDFDDLELDQPDAGLNRESSFEAELPWDDPEEKESEFDLGLEWREAEEEMPQGSERIPDDIDHPFEREEIDEDDIPF